MPVMFYQIDLLFWVFLNLMLFCSKPNKDPSVFWNGGTELYHCLEFFLKNS